MANHQLEVFEWDNVWWECADTAGIPRVLYIGDSISCGIRRIATQLTNEEILFDGFGTSKGIDNPYLMDSIKLFAEQEGKREAVLFNNGLHGWHLDDEKEYKEHFGAGCSKALSCQSVCPMKIETISSIIKMNRK